MPDEPRRPDYRAYTQRTQSGDIGQAVFPHVFLVLRLTLAKGGNEDQKYARRLTLNDCSVRRAQLPAAKDRARTGHAPQR